MNHTNPDGLLLNKPTGSGVVRSGYFRIAIVKAISQSGEVDVEYKSYVDPDSNRANRDSVSLSDLWSGSTSDERQPTVEHQIEETVCPVLDELDTIYEYTSVDYTIGVEVGVETVSHEMSWVEVEDELDRLFQEVDSIVD